MSAPTDDTLSSLRAATVGFDFLFSDDLKRAREVFAQEDSPFHQLGLGVCAFLEAALGMEVRAPLARPPPRCAACVRARRVRA